MTTPHWAGCESWSRERIEEATVVALRRQLAYVYEHSAFYRLQWDAVGWQPGDFTELADLARLPIVDKRVFAVSLAADPPWGSALAVPPQQVRRVHFSSGTTGTPTPMMWTAADLDRWADLYARHAYSQGVRECDVYQCLFSYTWFVGGLGATAGYQRLGATVIPAGPAEATRTLDTIFHFGTTVVGGTPSYLLYLAEIARQQGRELAAGPVRRVMVGGEPGGSVPATRERIAQAWGARCFDGYGSLEFQPIAWECAEQAGGHIPEDFIYAEVLDAASRVPVPDGEPGVLVLTHLDKQAVPLVRWWTGDVVVRDRTGCGCGRSHARLPGGVRGRADDMLVIRGVNVFPSAVEQVVRRHPAVAGEYRLVPGRADPATGYLTGIRVQVEVAGGQAELSTLRGELATALRAELGVRAQVEVLAEGTLPRSTGKSQRLLRDGGTAQPALRDGGRA